MMAGLSDEDRKFIEDAGDEYASFAHFGSGMGMRNSWGLWGDSPLSRYFARLGIYHADDMSAIINEAFSRRARGKDIQLEKLVQYYRDYWEKACRRRIQKESTFQESVQTGRSFCSITRTAGNDGKLSPANPKDRYNPKDRFGR
jgi:hypothetical protein